MHSSLFVLEKVAFLFLLIIAGLVLRRTRVVDERAIKGITGIIMKLTLPAMIIHSMASQKMSPAILVDSGLILIISFAVYAVLIALCFPLAKALGRNQAEQGVMRFVLVFSNVGFMGFPVVEAILGKEALFYTAIYNLPFNLLVFTVGIVLLLHGSKDKRFALSWQHLASPVILSIVAGFVLFFFQLPVPGFVGEVVKSTGDITTPLSMILVGAMLGGASLRSTLRQWRLYIVSVLRLVVWPLAVFGILSLITDNYLLIAVPTVITAMPAAANTALLANEYGADEKMASQAIFITTLLSIVSITLVAAMVQAIRQ